MFHGSLTAKGFTVAIVLAATAPTAVLAQSIVQTGRVNVYGSVQAYPTAPLAVRQSGSHNMVGIMQAGPQTSATVVQNGGTNTATLNQFQWRNIRDVRVRMP